MGNKFLQTIWWALSFGLFLTSIIMLIVAPEFSQFILSLFGISFGIFFLMLFINRKSIILFIRTNLFKNLVNNMITLVLIFGILGLLNYIFFKNNFHLDLTQQRVHTLSDQSKMILKDLKSPLKFILFARRNNWDRYLNLLNLYKYQSEKIDIEVIDVDTNPSLVQLNDVKEEGTVIIEYLGKKVSVNASSELALTNMIIKVMRSHEVIVYYLTGHGELQQSQQDQNGASFLFRKIKDTNYIIRPLDLLKVADVPVDASLVMALGPQNGFLDLEMTRLQRYIDKGGNFFVTLAPEMNDVKLNSLYKLLETFGIKFVNSIVLDRLSTVQGTQATIPIITDFNPTHTVTKSFSGKVLFPLTAAIIPERRDDLIYTPLLKTNSFPGSWAETSFDELKSGRATFDDKDLKGPIDIAAAVENKRNGSRIVVSTSTSFVINGYQSQSSNFNLFLNMLSWCVDDEGIISLNRPGLNEEKIILSSSQITLIFYFAIGFIPFLLFATAIFLYRRRLKK